MGMSSGIMFPPATLGVDPNMVSPPAGTPAAKLGVDPNSMSEKPKAKITSGGIPLYKMPHARLSECIEHIHELFDPSLIGQLAQKPMVAVIWLLSRVAPYMKLQDFRCMNASKLPDSVGADKTPLRTIRRYNNS